MTVAIFQTVRRKLKQYTTWSRILPRASLQLEKYSLSSRWLILFELRAKRQKVPIGSCWSNFLATRYHEPTNFAEQRLKCGMTTNDFVVIGVSFPSDFFEDGASFLDQSLRKDKQS